MHVEALPREESAAAGAEDEDDGAVAVADLEAAERFPLPLLIVQ